MKNVRVAVLRGGPSEEYEVSMRTGQEVITALEKQNYDVNDIVISRSGAWIVHGFERMPIEALSATDVVFIALHGSYGEDGTVQRLLDRLNIPYTGSKAYPSTVAMNKIFTKEKLKKCGIKMAPHMRVASGNNDLSRIALSIDALFGPDYIVKPIDGGSSIDTHVVSGTTELIHALKKSLLNRDEVLVEKLIRGREATVGVLERFRSQSVYRLPVIEIVPPSDAKFFDAEVKYNGKTEEICPGRFTREQKEELENIAHKVHKELDLAQYSRSDFIVADDGIYFLEVNTLPGLTTESLFPKALNTVGCSYEDFLVHLLSDALEKRV